MASEQQSREEEVGCKKKKEVEVDVQKDLVPKMASHYETLSEKVKDPSAAVSGGKDAKVDEARKDDNRKKSGEELWQKQGGNPDVGKEGRNRSSEKGKGGKEDVLDHAREKVSSAKDTAKEVAVKTLGSAKDTVAGISERTKELVIGKTEDEGRDRQEEEAKGRKIGGVLGAVGEALVEIAVSTKDLVFGKEKGDLWGVEDRDVVYDLGYGTRGEQEQQNEH